jgi:hypothetical protein
MSNFNKPELLLSYRGLDKVIFDKTFYFFGSKKGSRPIALDQKYMLDLCAYLQALQVRREEKEQELEQFPTAPNELLQSCRIFREKDYEVCLELDVYEGRCFIWLKLFRYFGQSRKPCKGCVSFHNADGQTLKDFYYQCIGNRVQQSSAE